MGLAIPLPIMWSTDHQQALLSIVSLSDSSERVLSRFWQTNTKCFYPFALENRHSFNHVRLCLIENMKSFSHEVSLKHHLASEYES